MLLSSHILSEISETCDRHPGDQGRRDRRLGHRERAVGEAARRHASPHRPARRPGSSERRARAQGQDSARRVAGVTAVDDTGTTAARRGRAAFSWRERDVRAALAPPRARRGARHPPGRPRRARAGVGLPGARHAGRPGASPRPRRRQRRRGEGRGRSKRRAAREDAIMKNALLSPGASSAYAVAARLRGAAGRCWRGIYFYASGSGTLLSAQVLRSSSRRQRRHHGRGRHLDAAHRRRARERDARPAQHRARPRVRVVLGKFLAGLAFLALLALTRTCRRSSS